MQNKYWIAVDEDGNETIHQYEPYYNRLHRKWKSNSMVYISKGISKILLTEQIINEFNSKLIIAIAYEVNGNALDNNKVSVINTHRIY